MSALARTAAPSRAVALGAWLVGGMAGPKPGPAGCGGSKAPPAGHAATGGPRGQALSLMGIAANCETVNGQTAALRTILLL